MVHLVQLSLNKFWWRARLINYFFHVVVRSEEEERTFVALLLKTVAILLYVRILY